MLPREELRFEYFMGAGDFFHGEGVEGSWGMHDGGRPQRPNKGARYRSAMEQREDDNGIPFCCKKQREKRKKVQRSLHEEMIMAEEQRQQHVLPPLPPCVSSVEVPVPREQFENAMKAKEAVIPTKWRHDRRMKEALAKMALCGELDAAGEEGVQENGLGKKLVMVVDSSNYVGHGRNGALVFQCSMCTYVGHRYYHAGMFLFN